MINGVAATILAGKVFSDSALTSSNEEEISGPMLITMTMRGDLAAIKGAQGPPKQKLP